MNIRLTLALVICACLVTVPVAWSRIVHHNGEIAYSSGSTLGVVGNGPATLAPCNRSGPGCFIPELAWSRHGKRLAFLRGHIGGAITKTNYALFVIRANGTHLRRVTGCGDCALGPESWSPDGSKIVLTGPCSRGVCGLTLVTFKTGSRRFVRSPCASGARIPAWSPDGSKIAFGCGASLYFSTRTGRGVHAIATVSGNNVGVDHPSWSPDSRTLTFDIPDSIFTVRADGSRLTLLRSGKAGNGPGVPSWSPDGTRIVYFNTPGVPNHFYPEVRVMNADGTKDHRIYHSASPVGNWLAPVWSPDGTQIAFSPGYPSGGLILMKADGSGLHSVVAAVQAFAWQPLP
jgi:Tol biopolymer transport system component